MKVALIGRPNVGKSCLFNALLGYRRSIVFDEPGTTRDTIVEDVEWDGHPFSLIDTLGIYGESNRADFWKTVSAADRIVFVVDAIDGPTAHDKWLAKELRVSEKPILVVVNKCEGKRREVYLEFSCLGFSGIEPISVLHRENIWSVVDWCVAARESSSEKQEQTAALSLAIVGRPNTGKSTLMNRLCGQKVSNVSETPHTTRDFVSYDVQSPSGKVRIFDTAGLRRRRQKSEPIEALAVNMAKAVIRKANVSLLLVDSSAPLKSQDLRIARLVEDSKKPVVVLLNFWDKVQESESQRTLLYLGRQLGTLFEGAAKLKISALTGLNVNRCIETAIRAFRGSQKRIATSQLNKFVAEVMARNPPPHRGKHNFNILYASQVRSQPPTFVFFMNRKEGLSENYKKYLSNHLQKRLGLKGQPVRLLFRGKDKEARFAPRA